MNAPETILVIALCVLVTYKACEKIDGRRLAPWFRKTRAAAALRWFFKNLFGG